MGITPEGSPPNILIGRIDRLPNGTLIEPHFVSRCHKERPDLKAHMKRLVTATSSEVIASHSLLMEHMNRDTATAYRGHASRYWDERAQRMLLFASRTAKNYIEQYASDHSDEIGAIHEVVAENGTFDQSPYHGREVLETEGDARVVGSRVVTLTQLKDVFGPHLERLTDTLDHPQAAVDLRATLQSGLLSLR